MDVKRMMEEDVAMEAVRKLRRGRRVFVVRKAKSTK
jgi:hypothetical protein